MLLSLPNPKYEDFPERYHHLTRITIDDKNTKAELPVHVILGATEFSCIKTTTKLKIGTPGEPVAKHTLFSWTLIAPEIELNPNNIYLTHNATQDYKRLCKLNVTGVEECGLNDENSVYQRFKKQLERDPSGRYTTSLL